MLYALAATIIISIILTQNSEDFLFRKNEEYVYFSSIHQGIIETAFWLGSARHYEVFGGERTHTVYFCCLELMV